MVLSRRFQWGKTGMGGRRRGMVPSPREPGGTRGSTQGTLWMACATQIAAVSLQSGGLQGSDRQLIPKNYRGLFVDSLRL
jgi:hypothetical protein